MIKTHSRILWANQNREVLGQDRIACFPTADSQKRGLERAEVDFLMKELSPLYVDVVRNLTKAFEAKVGVKKEVSEIILREPVVLIVYVILDRIIRLSKVLAIEGAAHTCVAIPTKLKLPETSSELISMIDNSKEFNQYLLAKLASSIWKIDTLKLDSNDTAVMESTKLFQNLNFDHPSFLTRITRKTSRVLSARFGKIPALRLANIEGPLLDNKLYGSGKLKWINKLELSNKLVRNNFLRDGLIESILDLTRDKLIGKYLINQIGLNQSEAERASKIFCELLLELIPVDRLEGIPNYLKCETRLSEESAPALFFCGMPTSAEIYWIAAAKKLGIPVIGVQHGVHYGFVNHPSFAEIELVYCDYFISWGWTKLPNNPLCKNAHSIPLPSPWLSGRKQKWKIIPRLSNGKRSSRSNDVLFMTDRIQLYPPSISTLRISSLDYLNRMNEVIWEIVSSMAEREIRVLCKPYNSLSRGIQTEVFKRLLEAYPKWFMEYEKLDKGLSRDLLEKAWLVLWDEPGTGFFECLISGIPSIVFWDRLTTQEEEFSRPYFELLEHVGLLHTNADSLANAVSDFLCNPEAWCSNNKRLDAIECVTNEYARTAIDWNVPWVAMINKFK